MRTRYQKLLPFVAIFIGYALALRVPPMEIDAAQYASISMEMLLRHSFLHVFDRGAPYLDKPPLLFWLGALSFRCFGIGAAAYKLPTLLFWCGGVYGTYRFAQLYYTERVAYLAALVLASCQAAFLMTNDVRTDTLLTACVALSIWQLAAYTLRKQWHNLVAAFGFVALAMLAKGPIGAAVPAMALAFHSISLRQWRTLFWWQWWVGVCWTVLLLSPMLWGLYTQYDLQPTQIVNGQTSVSGIQFFVWTQSFGRITGESKWQNDNGIFFFLHTTLWAFLPWAFLLYAAVYQRLRLWWQTIFGATVAPEFWSLGGVLLPWCALSLSHYKLPHYIFVVYPMAAVLTAIYIDSLAANAQQKAAQYWRVAQFVLANLLVLVAFGLSIWVFPSIVAGVFCVVLAGIVVFLYYQKTRFFDISPIVLPALVAIIGTNMLLNTHFYPQLLRYQANSEAGIFAQSKNLTPLYQADAEGSAALGFYTHTLVPTLHSASNLPEILDSLAAKSPVYIYANADFTTRLFAQRLANTSIVQTFDCYPVSFLTLPFLQKKYRSQTLQKRYLLRYKRLFTQ